MYHYVLKRLAADALSLHIMYKLLKDLSFYCYFFLYFIELICFGGFFLRKMASILLLSMLIAIVHEEILQK